MWPLYVWPLYVWALYVWPLYVSTNIEKYENYHEKCTSVLGPDVAEQRKVGKLPRKLTRLQFLGRMLQRQKRQKSTSFIVKTPFKSIAEHRKVRELPGKMNIEEVEAPKKYENLQTKLVLDPFKSTAEHRKVRELPRKMNIEEVEKPETMKIYRQNPFTPAAATRKLRKFTDETNMQARNHENSDEFRAPPVRHLDLATPAFTPTVRTPSVTTLFGEQKPSGRAWNCTVIIAFHCPTLALEDSCASLQVRRQIICNKSLSCDIGGLKSIFTSLWCVSLEDLCALPKPTKRKGYEYGARPCIASLPISFLPILNYAPRRMRLAWVWIWYTISVASSASCRATSLKSWLMKNHRLSSDSGASIYL